MTLGIRHWTDRENDLLETYWRKITEAELCRLLGRSWGGIRSHAHRLGLKLRKPENIDEEFLAELQRRIKA